MSSEDEEEDEGDIRKVMPGEAAAAAVAADAASANAALDTSVRALPCCCRHNPQHCKFPNASSASVQCALLHVDRDFGSLPCPQRSANVCWKQLKIALFLCYCMHYPRIFHMHFSEGCNW